MKNDIILPLSVTFHYLFMKLPSLSSLRFFEAAARYESFIKAAKELNVTHSAVSRQIRLLEEDLGISLFERRNRSVFLTAKGKILFQTSASIFEQLCETVKEIKSQEDSMMVTVSCEPTIAMKWLIPRLTSFYQEYPHITIHLVAAGGAIDFVKTNVDLALRRNDFKWDDQIYALKICDERMGKVYRPDISYDQLQDIALLSSTSRVNAWKHWYEEMDVDLQGQREIFYEHFYLCIQAALAGQGVALASFLMVIDEIVSGQLLVPSGFVEDGSAYYLLSPEEIIPESSIGIFTKWLLGQVDQSIKMTSSSASDLPE